MIHLLRSVGLAVTLSALSFYPFVPGGVDVAAGVPTLGDRAQFVVLGGVLFLVPVGLCWTARRMLRPVQSSPAPAARAPRLLVLVTLAAVTAVGLLAALGTWIGGSVSMGLCVLGITGVVLRWLRRRLPRHPDQRRAATAMSAYLVAMPAIASTLNVVLSEPMTVFSRNRAMDKAAVLVSGIERDYIDRTAYPRFAGRPVARLPARHRGHSAVSVRASRKRLHAVRSCSRRC